MPEVAIQDVGVKGDGVTVSGTVDGKPYTAHCWLSHLETLPSDREKREYLAQILTDEWEREGAPAPLPLLGTVPVERERVEPPPPPAPLPDPEPESSGDRAAQGEP